MMANDSQPDYANGKICYLEIPAVDIAQSSNFYQTVFGWHIRQDNEGNISFDDTVGQVSGMWVLNKKPSASPGILISIMVFDINDTIRLITENNGKLLQSPSGDIEKTALFADPAGNVFCLYQHGRG